MLFFTNEARKNAKEEISKLYVKLAETTPTDEWRLQDIESVMFYLREMKDELERQIKASKI